MNQRHNPFDRGLKRFIETYMKITDPKERETLWQSFKRGMTATDLDIILSLTSPSCELFTMIIKTRLSSSRLRTIEPILEKVRTIMNVKAKRDKRTAMINQVSIMISGLSDHKQANSLILAICEYPPDSLFDLFGTAALFIQWKKVVGLDEILLIKTSEQLIGRRLWARAMA